MYELKGLRTTYFGERTAGYNRQGFLTSKNRFVLRMEAAWIAFKAGQVSERKRTLYSEDLY